MKFLKQLFCDHYWVEAIDPKNPMGLPFQDFYRCRECTKGKYFSYTPMNWED